MKKRVCKSLVKVSTRFILCYLILAYTIMVYCKYVLPQVCNPAVQFMLYEGMLKKLTEKRVVTSRGVKHVSASEVFMPIIKFFHYHLFLMNFLVIYLQLFLFASKSLMTHGIMYLCFCVV